MDVVDKLTRSRMMSGITGRNTKPEMIVRKRLHATGLRFRLHRKDLPGRPDIVLPAWSVVVFVNGCFWHRHAGCRFATNPANNAGFWIKKFAESVARDRRQRSALKRLGWRVLTVWECQTRSDVAFDKLVERIRR